jgi:haloalkane dehalogenase
MPELPFPSWLDRQQYPFTPRITNLSAGGLHYVEEGTGDPILFVHGTPTWSFEFRHLIKALSPYGRCIAPDHLGFGLSERPPAFPYTPEAHAAMLEEFVDRLELDRITLVVHDFGGPIGLPLALRERSPVVRVVILNSWCWPLDDDAGMVRRARLAQGALGKFLYRHANASLKLIMPSAYGDRRKLTPAIHDQYLAVFQDRDSRVLVLHALAKALLGSTAFYARLLKDIGRLQRFPTLIIWGLKDTAFRPSQLARWQQLLPHARTVSLPDAGHWPHEEDPVTVSNEIAGMLVK